MAFPIGPTNGQQSTRYSRVFQYNGGAGRWEALYTVPPIVSPIPSSGSGGQTALASSTGGTIATTNLFLNATNDDFYQYRYHVFTSSSSFVSSGSGLVDILLVGGGGGGGGGQNGGYSGSGGSGGSVTILTNQTVAAQSYTVTVGAGGAAEAVGGASSVSGIAGASANGGALGAFGGVSALQAGSGAGGAQSGTASASSAKVGGPGLATDFFQHFDVTTVPGISHLRSETWEDMVYLGGGGTSGRAESNSQAANRGVALLGGGSGGYSPTYHSNFGWVTGEYTAVRGAMINTGGGGAAGLRVSSSITNGSPGGSGLVVIKYKI